jgi:hypothetical protein
MAACSGPEAVPADQAPDTTPPPTSATTTSSPVTSIPTGATLPPPTQSTTTTTTRAPTTVAPTTTLPDGVTQPPEWLGSRPLPLTPEGLGEVQPTPEELIDRRFTTVDFLPPPAGDEFEAMVEPVPDDVVARSTWSTECPVALDELRYVTASFVGFDGRPHTGEMIVNADAADVVVAVLRRLYESDFPIEVMRVTSRVELDLPPTGDGNTTSGFVCRPTVGATTWSQHAYGLAIDINPFHNPYHRGDVVIPELASAYLDRDDVRPGMILADDVVVSAFTDIGWGWGGSWSSLVDPMHFSANGS